MTRYERTRPTEFPCQYGVKPYCCHITCGAAAGLVDPILVFNADFSNELHHGWLRFDLDQPKVRQQRARLYWAMRKHYRNTGEFAIMACVGAAVLPAKS